MSGPEVEDCPECDGEGVSSDDLGKHDDVCPDFRTEFDDSGQVVCVLCRASLPLCTACEDYSPGRKRPERAPPNVCEAERGREVGWVEIHGAKLHCPCGHVTDYTDHVRSEFLSRPEHACEGCGKQWGTPAAADCEDPMLRVRAGSAKDRMASSTDCLIGRLPAGTRVTIDVGRAPPFGLGCNAIVSVGVPDATGGWKYGLVGTAWEVFSPERVAGDHVFENALHDAFEMFQARCAEYRADG